MNVDEVRLISRADHVPPGEGVRESDVDAGVGVGLTEIERKRRKTSEEKEEIGGKEERREKESVSFYERTNERKRADSRLKFRVSIDGRED